MHIWIYFSYNENLYQVLGPLQLQRQLVMFSYVPSNYNDNLYYAYLKSIKLQRQPPLCILRLRLVIMTTAHLGSLQLQRQRVLFASLCEETQRTG